MPKYINQTELM